MAAVGFTMENGKGHQPSLKRIFKRVFITPGYMEFIYQSKKSIKMFIHLSKNEQLTHADEHFSRKNALAEPNGTA